MKILNIHIGYHKTATSSLQKFLALNASKLRKSGINYVRSGLTADSHGNLANSLKPEKQNLETTRTLWRKLLSEVEDSECPESLISSECFLEYKEMPRALASVLDGRVRAKIICYLRPQLDWLESVFNEVVKDPYRRFTGEISDLREIRSGWIFYNTVLQSWCEQFGKDSLVVRKFDQNSFINGSVFDDFLSALNIKPSTSLTYPSSQNISLHPSLTEFLRRSNLIPMLNPLHNNLVLALQDFNKNSSKFLPIFEKPVSRMSTDQVQNLLAGIELDIVALGQTFPEVRDLNEAPAQRRDTENRNRIELDELLLPAELEHRIFNSLPSRLRNHFELQCESVKSRESNKHFLPKPANEIVARLRAELIRQRIEARQLYAEIHQHKITGKKLFRYARQFFGR